MTILTVFVMGVSGSGKSTIGRLAATALSCRYLEGDAFHSPENIIKMKAGIPLDDQDRWPWLDRLAEAADAAATSEGVAVASCSALKRIYRDRLRAATSNTAVFVHLRADRSELVTRLQNRPDHYMPLSLLDSQIGTLEALAQDEPSLIVNASIPPERIVGQIADWVLSIGSTRTGIEPAETRSPSHIR